MAAQIIRIVRVDMSGVAGNHQRHQSVFALAAQSRPRHLPAFA
jgi:hypothetical protein